MTSSIASVVHKGFSLGLSRRGLGWTLLVVLVALLVGAPVLVVTGHLLIPTWDVWQHLYKTVLSGYVWNSVLLMLGVGFGVVFGGVGTAWLVTMCQFRGAKTLEWALLLPMAMPAYVVAYAYTDLLSFTGPIQEALRAAFGWRSAREYWFPEIRSLGGVVTLMSLVLYPYVYMLARAAFLEQSICVLEASRTLGRSPWRAFWSVALPLARPAIVAGTALALMETLNDFGTVDYFAVDTFTTGIYRMWLGLGQADVAAQLGAVLMLFVLVLIVTERLSRGGQKYHHTTSRYRQLPRFELRGFAGVLAQIFCFIPVVLGFLAPAGVLLWWAYQTGTAGVFGGDFLTLAGNSVLLAVAASVLAVGVAVLLAYALRLSPNWATRSGVRLAGLGYAVPGSVIAVGTLIALGYVDRVLGIITIGSMGALIYAYMVRFLAVSYNGVEASLGKVTASMESASRTLGNGPFKTLWRVHVPIMRGSLLSAGLLVFVDVMKELPATLIMRPFNFDTLAVRTYSLASDERLVDAGPAALAIVLAGLIPVVFLSRAIAKSRPGGQ